jgi:hypothetical protein
MGHALRWPRTGAVQNPQLLPKPFDSSEFDFLPKETQASSKTQLGNVYPRTRQTLATPQVFSPQKKQIVQIALLPPRRLLLVQTEVLIADRFQSFPRSSRLLKNLALLVAQLLQPHELYFEFPPVPEKFGVTLQSEAQFGRGHSRTQLPRPLGIQPLPAQVDLLDRMLASRHLMVGGTQPQFLLMLQALAEMQNGLQRKMECHDLIR